MKKSKTQKGITLVALIITIIVLLILAVVAIRAVQGDGIIAHAKNARDNYNDAQIAENGVLSDYLTKIEENLPGGSSGGTAQTITADKLNTVLSTTANTPLLDKYGNKITVPAGFKIVVDNTSDASKSTSYTADTIDVTKGIVIEDGSGNQFVWIPVGNIKTSTTDTVGTPITLGRYSWDGSTPTLVQPTNENPVTSEVNIPGYAFKESQPTENGKSENGNAIARNINDFYNSSVQNGGYYLGRYEASASGSTIASKANQDVYVNITQSTASDKAKAMYADGFGTGTFSSDLINSYAWDTAIIFIQTFGTETDASTYASKNKCNGLKQTGSNQQDDQPDKYRNIYDLSGNACEWTTETCNAYAIYTYRGGAYLSGIGSSAYAGIRSTSSTGAGGSDFSFRPILYVAINS